MTTNVNPKIEELEKELKKKIKEVEAAQEWHDLRKERAAVQSRAGTSGTSSLFPVDSLRPQLLALENQRTALRNDLAELRKEKNLLLEKKRMAQCSRALDKRCDWVLLNSSLSPGSSPL